MTKRPMMKTIIHIFELIARCTNTMVVMKIIVQNKNFKEVI
ncbi:hypothetical protein BN3590_01376 [Clostridium sp. C105KSO15]|nr:hypothetical protein BN3590_01376 [Clostridium sp. C105KSO15]